MLIDNTKNIFIKFVAFKILMLSFFAATTDIFYVKKGDFGTATGMYSFILIEFWIFGMKLAIV
jgi:hypothetical protein